MAVAALAVVAAVIVMMIGAVPVPKWRAWWAYVAPPDPATRVTPVPPPSLNRLLAACLGDRARPRRLMDYERQFAPGADDETLIVNALQRLEQDNRRHG